MHTGKMHTGKRPATRRRASTFRRDRGALGDDLPTGHRVVTVIAKPVGNIARMSDPYMFRIAEYARPSHLLVHLSDTHLRSGTGVFGIDAAANVERVMAELEQSGGRPDALVFTGDLADLGEPEAYARLRASVEPAASIPDRKSVV